MDSFQALELDEYTDKGECPEQHDKREVKVPGQVFEVACEVVIGFGCFKAEKFIVVAEVARCLCC